MKKLIALLLATAMLFCMAACGKNNDANNDKVQSGTQQTPDNEQALNTDEPKTRIVTDALGREVEIPAKVESIVPLGNTPRMISYLGLADLAVGIEECEIASSPLQAYAYPHVEKWSTLPNCGTNSMGETAYYPEQIMIANPDVSVA